MSIYTPIAATGKRDKKGVSIIGRNTLRAALATTILVVAYAITSLADSAQGAARADTQTLAGSYLAGLHAAQNRDIDAAAEFYLQVLEHDPQNTDILNRAFLLELTGGNMEVATGLATRIVKIDEHSRLARYALGVKAMRARSFTAARRQFAQAEHGGPIGEIMTALLTAWAYQGAGDTDSALDAFSELKGSNWFETLKSYHLGLISEMAGRHDVAKAHYAAAYESEKSLLRVAEAYIRLSARTGDMDTARKILNEYETVMADHPIMSALRAAIDAGKVVDPIIKSPAEGAAEGLYGIGAALGRDNGDDLATIFLELARHLNPQSDLVLASLAGIHESSENYERAIKYYQEIEAESPLWINARIQYALNLNALERTDEAVEALAALIDENPDDTAVPLTLGNILRGNKDYTAAAKAYSQAIDQIDEIQQTDWNVYYSRGIAYERMGEWPKAEADLLQALELRPDDPQILNYLGYSWIDQGLYLERALNMIRRAVNQRPTDGFIVDSLGWAYYRLGRFKEAVEELEKAVELRPDDPIINDHLGDAYWRAGRRNEARFQWRQAIDLEPEDDQLADIQAKLDAGLPEQTTEKRAEDSKSSNGG